MSEMVERVAQALFDRECQRAKLRGRSSHHKEGTLVVNMPPSYRDDYLSDARAAIEAMREPTEGMADQIIYSQLETIQQGEDLWRAMIDAALASDPVTP